MRATLHAFGKFAWDRNFSMPALRLRAIRNVWFPDSRPRARARPGDLRGSYQGVRLAPAHDRAFNDGSSPGGRQRARARPTLHTPHPLPELAAV